MVPLFRGLYEIKTGTSFQSVRIKKIVRLEDGTVLVGRKGAESPGFGRKEVRGPAVGVHDEEGLVGGRVTDAYLTDPVNVPVKPVFIVEEEREDYRFYELAGRFVGKGHVVVEGYRPGRRCYRGR